MAERQPIQTRLPVSQCSGGKRRAQEIIAQANNQFALNLFKHIAADTHEGERNDPKNIFFSPLSISSAFAMLSLGAKSQTLEHILEGLSLNQTQSTDQIHLGFEYLLRSLNKPKSDLKVNIGNAVFVEQSTKILESFLQELKQHYEAEILASNFQAPEDAEKQINDYVKDKTDGKIERLVSDLDPDTKLLLVNYILFKGEWLSPFSPELTHRSKFSINENTTVEVEMMSRTGIYNIYKDDQLPCFILQLPYKDNATMIVAVPELGKLSEVEEALSEKTITRWRTSGTESWAEINLPKFSISSDLKLKSILCDMGMSNIFSKKADFSGITNDEKLKVSKVVHKAVLDVNEKGTIAAASTAIDMTPDMLMEQYNADKPFLVFIYSQDTNNILFMGRVVNPVEK
ncbi:hypothetical protein GDO86_015946 [Hymenochirus boettgeri]|uniref:Thyroxine-binding globulin n=1 Tax=Hymenochirus boettgeri TaxID=247094 RepID=A0A8T2JZY2_9PIPI|nr:hypothetical protein GDO86_015946 [Hymenochirus boettgeri]